MTAVRIRKILRHVLLGVAVIVSLFPFYWTVVLATNTTQDVFRSPPKLTFGPHLFDNIQKVLQNVDLIAPIINTVVVAICTTVLVLFFDSLAAFAFAKYDFAGRKILFGLLLVMFMVPTQLALIPQFVIMTELGWVGDLKALVIPAAANAFGIFWMRQYISNAVPDEMLDAAKIDGAGFFRIYRSIILPVIRPGLAFLGIFTFIAAWNDYVWPLIVLLDPNKVTLQVALSQLNVGLRQDYSVLMAGALIGVLPLIVVFTLIARNFISDSIKGSIR